MEGHAKEGGERHCELAEKSISAFKPAETLCMDDHQFSPNGVNCTRQLGTSFINQTTHFTQKCFVGDESQDCQLWTISGRFFCWRFAIFHVDFRRRLHFYDFQQHFGTPMLRTTCGPNKRHSLSHSIDHVFLERVYHVPRNIPDNSFPARLYMFKDNEAVIRMIVKDRRPNVRHVSRTHRIDLECLFERIIVDSSMSIRCAYHSTIFGRQF